MIVTWILEKVSLSHKIVSTCNSLSEDVITCKLVNSFKAKLDKFLACRGFI
jgi:hypothetical protein